MAAIDSQYPASILINQHFNLNPMLIKMRKMKDKLNQNASSSKHDKSLDASSPFSNDNGRTSTRNRKSTTPFHIPLADKIKMGLADKLQ